MTPYEPRLIDFAVNRNTILLDSSTKLLSPDGKSPNQTDLVAIYGKAVAAIDPNTNHMGTISIA